MKSGTLALNRTILIDVFVSLAVVNDGLDQNNEGNDDGSDDIMLTCCKISLLWMLDRVANCSFFAFVVNLFCIFC